MTISSSELLAEAADLLEGVDFLYKGHSGAVDDNDVHPDVDDPVCACALTSVMKVSDLTSSYSSKDADYEGAKNALADYLILTQGAQGSLDGFGNHSTIIEWNDAPGRTKAEVVSVLREAAQFAEDWDHVSDWA